MEYTFTGRPNDKIDSYMKRKLTFLNEMINKGVFKDNTALVYYDMFKAHINYLENAKGKDLYQFTQSELVEIVKNAKTTSKRTKRTIVSTITSYIDWVNNCTDWDTIKEDPFLGINLESLLEINARAIQKSYLTLTKFWVMINDMEKEVDATDLVILVLARYGVPNNLLADVEWKMVGEKFLTITNSEGKELNLPIDEKFINYINKVKNIKEYDASNIPGRSKIRIMEDYGYVIKTTSDSEAGKVKDATIYTRCNKIFTKTGYKRISTSKLNTFRKFDFLNELAEEKANVITLDDLKYINSIFSKSTPTMNNTLEKDYLLLRPDVTIKGTRAR